MRLSDEFVDVPERALLLSVDFEDWHQLVRRRVGDPAWREPGPALERETEALRGEGAVLIDAAGARRERSGASPLPGRACCERFRVGDAGCWRAPGLCTAAS